MKDDQDLHFFREGTHARLYNKLGCRPRKGGGADFAVWAPNAKSISVVGDWNSWSGGVDRLEARGDGIGIWEGFVGPAKRGQCYKYRIHSSYGSHVAEKADPFAFYSEAPPARASRIWTLEHAWKDDEWMSSRGPKNALDAPMSVYEVHLGSWRRKDGRFLDYRELGPWLADYVIEMGFTHV